MFPIIETIADVMPAVEGRQDMSVMDKDGYTVVKYNFQSSGTFDETPHGIMRRECRGLLFDTEGRLISRPFHKFFNVGEKEETFPRNIDLSRPHVVQEKLDGSMIRAFLLDGEIEFATKSGITDTSVAARKVFDALDTTGEKLEWIVRCVRVGFTPLFEYVGPRNRIVLKYGKPDLVFLAMRNNRTGEYYDRFGARYPGSIVEQYDAVSGNMDEYVDRVRGEEGREGDVLVFEDGFRVKIKSSWYVRIHGIKQDLEKGRYIGMQALDGTLDDALSVLSAQEREDVEKTADGFLADYGKKLSRIEDMLWEFDCWAVSNGGENPRKAAALEFVTSLADRSDAKYVFSHMDGKDAKLLYDAEVRKGLGSDTRYDVLREWMRN